MRKTKKVNGEVVKTFESDELTGLKLLLGIRDLIGLEKGYSRLNGHGIHFTKSAEEMCIERQSIAWLDTNSI